VSGLVGVVLIPDPLSSAHHSPLQSMTVSLLLVDPKEASSRSRKATPTGLSSTSSLAVTLPGHLDPNPPVVLPTGLSMSAASWVSTDLTLLQPTISKWSRLETSRSDGENCDVHEPTPDSAVVRHTRTHL
jgi:hypothetical protein